MITLKSLPTATAQQVFDQVAIHLLTQDEKSFNENEDCVYRGKNNLKCAAGCLIADDEYDKNLNQIHGLILFQNTLFLMNMKN